MAHSYLVSATNFVANDVTAMRALFTSKAPPFSLQIDLNVKIHVFRSPLTLKYSICMDVTP